MTHDPNRPTHDPHRPTGSVPPERDRTMGGATPPPEHRGPNRGDGGNSAMALIVGALAVALIIGAFFWFAGDTQDTATLDDPADRLVGRAAERCGRAIAAQLLVRGEDVQLFPRGLHNGCPSGLHGGGFTSPLCDPGASPGGQGRSRGGDFLLAMNGDFVMATGSRTVLGHRS